MKLTKKAAALLLAASLAVSVCAMPVFAEDSTLNRGSTTAGSSNASNGVAAGSTSVFYKVTESYTWSIPATIDFGENAGVGSTSTVEAKLDKNVSGEQAKKVADNTWKGTAPKVTVIENVIGVGKTLKIAVDTGKNYADSFDTEKNKFYVESEFKKTGSQTSVYEKLYFTIAKPAVGSTTSETLLNADNNEVLRVPSGTNTEEQALEFKLETTTDTAEKAGSYVGYVWFYSNIVDSTT